MRTTSCLILRYGHQLRATLVGIFLCVLGGGGLLACSSGGSSGLAQIWVMGQEPVDLRVSLGDVVLGSSASSAVTVENTGTADLVLTSISVESVPAGTFILTPGGTTSGVIAPGDSQEVSVTYQPTLLGPAEGTLLIQTDLVATPEVRVVLDGNGLAVPVAQLSIDPAAVVFSNDVLVGVSERLTATLSNTGNADLIITEVAIESPEPGAFVLDRVPSLPLTIVPGAEATTVDIIFGPSSPGTKTGTLHVRSNVDGGSDRTIGLSGTSLPAPAPQMAVSPTKLTYSELYIGQSQTASIVISNLGDADLLVQELIVEGAVPAVFRLGDSAPSLPAKVVAGETLTVVLVFEPLLAGDLTGRLRVAGTAPDTPVAEVELVGTGLALPVVALTPLSSKAHLGSGGDALIQVAVDPDTFLDQLQIELDGSDVTPLFRPVTDTGAGENQYLRGLVSSLATGDHNVTITVLDANQLPIPNAGTTLTLTNWPITGPLISGPHETPFICQTESFSLGAGLGELGVPLDANCSATTRVDFVYRSTDGLFKVLEDVTEQPEDLEQATTTTGASVPYIVRLETGTINRSIYQTAVLATSADGAPDPWQSGPGWNGRLVYKFGGGCRTGWYRQGDGPDDVLDHMMLSKGYAVASASLNVFRSNCNTLLAAETMMMVKERFVERNGLPQQTIGWGCSGGAYQVHFIADNYPGLLDGIIPQCSFPEVAFGTTHTVADARLLETYFTNGTTVSWGNAAQLAVTGFGVLGHLAEVSKGTARIDPVPNRSGHPSAEFNSVVPSNLGYDPETNPDGARATIYDHTVVVYGREVGTGFARRPLDNVGIQYGLRALNDGAISIAQFLDLNDHIGGFDIDANPVDNRMEADLDATRRAYMSGQLISGGGGLASTPILDIDTLYTDLKVEGDIHMKFQRFGVQERLRLVNGHNNNFVMWNGAGEALQRNLEQGLALMDDWLTQIQLDTSEVTAVDKVVQNKPSGLTDGCWDATDNFVPEPQEFGGVGTSTCNDLYPSFSSPRMVAGGPLANDIVKCELKPIDLDDYNVTFDVTEENLLRQIFPNGVCDWAQPGVEQQSLRGLWLSFGPSPINLIAPED